MFPFSFPSTLMLLEVIMVRLITDSAADFEPHELEQLKIHCIPLTVMFGESEYQENINLTKNQFYELLLSSGNLPKTAQSSPQILMDLFEDAVASGNEAIYITLSSALSGTYQSALMAKNLTDSDMVHVVDARNATGGQRLILEYAAKLRDEGKSAAEIIAGIEQIRSRIVLYACIDTLEYLYKGGRISHTTYKLGTLANIKPIISIDRNGRVAIPAKAMGMRKGMDYLCKRVSEIPSDPHFPLYVMYTNNRGVAQTLAARLSAAGYPIAEDRIIQVGAAIGSHIGPDACGLVYVESTT
jgi:DegV family protein with EDD domain